MASKKVIIMGAAGRDFHNFNVIFRDNKDYEVVAFTATQIPDIEGRKYPAKLAGKLYPKGVPIHAEDEIVELIQKHDVDEVVFSYSDVSYDYVMSRAAVVVAAGADFKLLSATDTMIRSKKPVVAICAARTGSGKSQTTRRVCEILKEMGHKVAAIRHPMPYGDLVKQTCQRFAKIADLKKHNCTIEEMEEYEPHINRGQVIYAGVDYGVILEEAEKEADIIVWDGGNNDTSFYRPDVLITVVDPHRPGHEMLYYPGGTNVLLSDVVVINKVDTASFDDINLVRDNVMTVNPEAYIVEAASPITVDKPELILDKDVLVVEDGPTLTHGEMTYGAGVVAAQKYGAASLVDPRPYTVKSISETFEKYPEIGTLLPAMGYGDKQMKDLETTINRAKCDTVIIATPIDLRRVINIKKKTVRVGYDLQEIGHPNLEDILQAEFSKTKATKKKTKKAKK
ncbi:MAG: GTPase [candidate division Zixibacteria bacterium]|nr:GTPase [candidate division Zixibacteria bacterium]